MKQEIHPDNYRLVIFHDTASGEQFLISSTVETDQTGTFDGKEYPLHEIEISSASHPFFTGQEKTLDTAGRVEKFKQRRQQAKEDTGKKKKKDNDTDKEANTGTEGSISIDASQVENN